MSATADVLAGHDLLQRLSDSRSRTDEMFEILRPDSIYERPIAERHRIVFYIGHLEAFDWNLFHERVFGLQRFQPELDRLFAFGIDPVGKSLPSDQPSDWPSLAAVRKYVNCVRSVLDEELARAITRCPDQLFDGVPLSTLLNVAIEHRLMHAETLAYMFHQLPLNRKIFQAELLPTASAPFTHRTIEIPEGTITLGLSRASGAFGWDNEFEQQASEVPTFKIDQHKVTNGQFLEFVLAGGYSSREFWTHSGDERDWTWKSEQAIFHPAFWRREGNDWLYRTMFQDIPVPLDWPVYVSQAEAKAYAKWAGQSLPTEAEWARAAYGTPNRAERAGDDLADEKRGNFDFANWSPVPVTACPQNESAFGVRGMLGNGWEWTSTEFSPYPGFEPFRFYPGYSADFFDGKHFVMKGGSSRTAACMLRPSFRNWFQAHYQFTYTGFRCVTRYPANKTSDK